MKIKKLVLQTAYLKTLEEFYSSVLELPVQATNENEILINIGTSDLIFADTNETEPFYHFAINIPSNKTEEAKDWLSKKVKLLWMEDYKSEIADFVNWHAKSVYFYDPAGNILELIARFDLNNAGNEAFSSKQLLSINEMGLVFKQNEFEQKVSELLNNHFLSYFSKQSPLPQFRAIGDDEGLFVVVPQHRNWFPTDKPSGMFPICIEFENERQEYRLELN
jgi:catechol 2,3-dioxygenase-like lactoylglutathione lyase family enzyme